MISIFNLTLAANESREVAITGEYFELRNALYPVALIELLDRSGGVVSRLENPEQSDFVRPGRYETVRVTNGPTPQTIKHFYGTGDAGSRRTSGLVRIDGSSDVSVIDGEKSRTLAGGALAAGANLSAVAGQYQLNQLWNPGGSLKNVIVQSLGFSSALATGIWVYWQNTAAATDQTATRMGNKRAGSAAGVAQVRVDSVVGFPVPVAGAFLRNHNIAANQTINWDVRGAVVLPPGYGLTVLSTVANTGLSSNFEFFEEAI